MYTADFAKRKHSALLAVLPEEDRAVPPRPNPAEPFVSHHYTVLAPAVVRVGNTKFNKKTGNLTVGEQVGCVPLLARLTQAACISDLPTCSSVSFSG